MLKSTLSDNRYSYNAIVIFYLIIMIISVGKCILGRYRTEPFYISILFFVRKFMYGYILYNAIIKFQLKQTRINWYKTITL